MNGHPGGTEHTIRLLKLAGLPDGARILDMGAGAGDAVHLAEQMGYTAEGIDLAPRSKSVRQGDLLCTHYADGSFDAVLSQCAFFLSGDIPAALREAKRILRPGGLLLLSDVFFEPPEQLLSEAGFALRYQENMTEQWRDYYLEALWREETICCEVPHGVCEYWLLIAERRDGDGSV